MVSSTIHGILAIGMAKTVVMIKLISVIGCTALNRRARHHPSAVASTPTGIMTATYTVKIVSQLKVMPSGMTANGTT